MPARFRIASPAATSGAAHPARQHRLAAELARYGFKRFGRLRRIGHRLRRQDHQQAVAVRVLGRDLERLGVALRRRRRRGRRSGCRGSSAAGRNSLSVCHRLRRELGQLAAAGDQRVGRQHARAAGIGDDRQARAPRARLLGQHLGHVEQVGDRVRRAARRSGGRRRRARRRCRSASRCARRRPCAAASVRPALITMIGLVSATSRAAERNARASPIDSM